jgi:hypothetical protein
MAAIKLTTAQREVARGAAGPKVLVAGPAGCGKTTAAARRLETLVESGIDPRSILVLLPQRTLDQPYRQALERVDLPAGVASPIRTFASLAVEMVTRFWPQVARQAGFSDPEDAPLFLNVESAQVVMAGIVRPMLAEGAFEGISIEPGRIVSQILNDLDKAAGAGIPHGEIGKRLKDAWSGDSSYLHIYDEVQDAASRFRSHCLQHNMLDFSLLADTFANFVLPLAECQALLASTYRHLVADNIEEDNALAHDLLAVLLPALETAVLVADSDAGYRTLLGADPSGVARLGALCAATLTLDRSFVGSPAMRVFEDRLNDALDPGAPAPQPFSPNDPAIAEVVALGAFRFQPQMIDWVTAEIQKLVRQGVPPGEITVLAPVMPDVLRFAVTNRLAQMGIATRSFRPSRGLREEPHARGLLTLAMLAHPDWGLPVTRAEVTQALIQAIDGLDLVRGQLLTEIVLRQRDGVPTLGSFDAIHPDVQERISQAVGGRYETLRAWLSLYRQAPEAPPDVFFERLLNEVLTQPGFGFTRAPDSALSAERLLASARRFVQVAPALLPDGETSLGRAFTLTLMEGGLAGQHIPGWQAGEENAVFIAPLTTFLLSNQPVDYQFWLDVAGRGWWERLYQPLTQPFVLGRDWPPGRVWTDADEVSASQASLRAQAIGLLRRCRRKVYLAASAFSDQGYEQRGALWRAVDRIMPQPQPVEEESHV